MSITVNFLAEVASRRVSLVYMVSVYCEKMVAAAAIVASRASTQRKRSSLELVSSASIERRRATSLSWDSC
jgi:hypothetical protein